MTENDQFNDFKFRPLDDLSSLSLIPIHQLPSSTESEGMRILLFVDKVSNIDVKHSSHSGPSLPAELLPADLSPES